MQYIYVHVYICVYIYMCMYIFFLLRPQNRLSQKHTVLVLDLEVYKKTQTVLYKELLKLSKINSTVLAVKFGGLGTILWRS